MILAEFDVIEIWPSYNGHFLILAEFGLYWSSLSKEVQFMTAMIGNAFAI